MIKTRVVQFNQYGGPEVLELKDLELPDILDDEVRILHKAIGVNFIDTYYRTGLYQTSFPSALGNEGAGIIEAVGKNVTHLKIGDRVAYVQGPLGSYSERRNLSARFVVKIPDSISFQTAASLMLKGLTVRYLFKDIHELKKDEIFLFHAAAGGVGLIACQWARHIGAKLIGTTSSKEKAEVAKSHGAWEMINYVEEDITTKVNQLTQGRKVSVVFDSVGKLTWKSSLNCLQTRGMLVSFGNASGAVTGINLSDLQTGSFFVTRPILFHYIDTLEKLELATKDLFELVQQGIIKTEYLTIHGLEDVVEAHKDLSQQKRIGGIVLVP